MHIISGRTASDIPNLYNISQTSELSVRETCTLTCTESQEECREVQSKTETPTKPTYLTYSQN
eukprot:4689180-Pleurochrysis_carterae.AAC.1